MTIYKKVCDICKTEITEKDDIAYCTNDFYFQIYYNVVSHTNKLENNNPDFCKRCFLDILKDVIKINEASHE